MIPLYIDDNRTNREQLVEALNAWHDIREHGSDVKVWPEFMTLNLIRIKIARLRKRICEEEGDDHGLDENLRELPPRMDYNYLRKG